MFSSNRAAMRGAFMDAWRKFRRSAPLEPLERLIAEVVRQHPEYHKLLEKPEQVLDKDYLPEAGETNPFLHMGMHLSLQEQIGTDRPPGIRALYERLVLRSSDAHESEHRMMECLGRVLWEAQRQNRMPDDQAYLECVRRLT
jgi:hypothetical protein